jgi:hypothetical protein
VIGVALTPYLMMRLAIAPLCRISCFPVCISEIIYIPYAPLCHTKEGTPHYRF